MNKNLSLLSLLPLILLTGCQSPNIPTAPSTQPTISYQENEAVADNSKLRICPDELIENRMPGTVPTDPQSASQTMPSAYYILDGSRREIAEFDQNWVNQNCDVTVQEVW
ncbi:hypothetical protein GW756_00100 [bacterium]|nr:hypothetical protein [bacterium]NCQ54759.1 hypothetical protein [Candidatus Parcubacteria bacterium]NCS68012.1 hypothetical protein [Candidatus Peregrinibacteria bacterium]NCS95749.1 hypothetical protein [bacterium]